ncbi:MAG: multidrug effflux MFS transporter [Chloroflexota bacterium]|nr:multidrug effflux MFS transporter [Chloroflexota bacterium]
MQSRPSIYNRPGDASGPQPVERELLFHTIRNQGVTALAQSAPGNQSPVLTQPLANESTHPIERRTSTLVLVLMSLAILGPLSIDMYLPALPALQRDLGASASLAQLTLSACLLGLASGQLIAGPLSDVVGRRPPVLVGIAGFIVMSFLCSIAPNIESLILFRFLQGVAGSAGVVVSRAVIRDLYSGIRSSQMFSLLVLANGIGPILAPTLGGVILLATDWRGVFGVLVGLGVVIVGVAWRYLPETNQLEQRSTAGVRMTLSAFGMLLRDRSFVAYSLVMAMGMSTMFAHVAGSSFVLQNIYGVSEQVFAVLFGVIAIGYIGTSQLNARLINTVPMRTMLRLGVGFNLLGTIIVFLVVNVFDLGLWGLTAGLFLVAMSNGFIGPNVTALALNGYPRVAGSASAMLGLLTFASGAIVAPLVGIAGDQTAVPQTLVILGCSLIGVAALGVLSRQRASVPTVPH